MDKKFFMDNLQLEESEYALIRDPQRGSCLYKCGNERYLLQVQAPEYKQTIDVYKRQVLCCGHRYKRLL